MRNKFTTAVMIAILGAAGVATYTDTAQAVVAKPAAKTSAPSWAPFGTKPCKVEDADGPCYWDAGKSGNGRGQSFYVIPLGKGKVSLTYPFAPRLNKIVNASY